MISNGTDFSRSSGGGLLPEAVDKGTWKRLSVLDGEGEVLIPSVLSSLVACSSAAVLYSSPIVSPGIFSVSLQLPRTDDASTLVPYSLVGIEVSERTNSLLTSLLVVGFSVVCWVRITGGTWS